MNKIILWFLTIFMFTGTLTFMPSFTSFLLLIVGVAIMPIGKLQDFINKIIPWKKAKTIGIILICILGLAVAPTNSKISDDSDKDIASNLSIGVADEKSPGADMITSATADGGISSTNAPTSTPTLAPVQPVSVSEIPAYSGKAYVAVNGNVPNFTEMSTTSFENYSSLDSLGRCGVAYACLSKDTMPTEERGSIGQVKPSGWHTVKYDFVDGKYLYNRCHLIGFQLSAENANESNLITGTRYMNVDGMLPFENMVADYIKETGNHVMFRVTPIYDGNNLVANGVQMEAKSVEDNGAGILYNVFCYNVQPGVKIDYATGESSSDGTMGDANGASSSNSASANSSYSSSVAASNSAVTTQSTEYILNTNTKKFHEPSCSSVKRMKDSNKQSFSGTRDQAISKGYDPCKNCNP